MKHFHTAVALAAVMALAGTAQAAEFSRAAPSRVAPNKSVPVSADETARQWFVELQGAPLVQGRTAAALRAEKQAFRRAAAGLNLRELYSYDRLFNGFAVEIDPRQRARLAALPGVKAIYPVIHFERPAFEVGGDSAPDINAALHLTGAAVLQNSLGLSGEGVKVAVIDTGVDYDHPAFGGSGVPGGTAFPTARVVGGWDFVGDNYDSSGTPEQQIPVPDDNPDDVNGHGTHVAAIVGADGGGFTGVAPKSSLYAYRVFGAGGTSSAAVIMAALERAYDDGVHVVNLSLGAARQWPQYPTSVATDRLADKGVVVVASIGNNGPGGSSPDAQFAAGAPGVGPKTLGIASYDNAQRAFSVAKHPYGYVAATGAPLPPSTGSLPLARTGTPASVDDGCLAAGTLPPGSLAGQAVLIRRGTCGFHEKALNAQNAGAAAVVLYNNAAGAFSPTVAGTPAITIPVAAVTQAQGGMLDGVIAGGGAALNWTADYVGFPYGTGGLISGFSSFGLTAELQLKPNLGAPGGAIYAAVPLEQGGAGTKSGTSMSAPHVAGGVALLLQARPGTSVDQIRLLVQNTGAPKAWAGNPDAGLLDNVHRQGAGMLDLVAAVNAQVTASPPHLLLGASAAGDATHTLTVHNAGTEARTYAVSHEAALATGPNTQAGASYNVSSYYNAPATVSFSVAKLPVAPGGSAQLSVTVQAPEGLVDRGIYGGYVVLTPSDGGEALRVPYAGFKGDYQSTQVLTPTANGFPWLARQSGTTYTNQPGGASFTLEAGDIPHIVYHLDHHSRLMQFSVADAATGRDIFKLSSQEFVSRNSTPTGFFTLAWDGSGYPAPSRVIGQPGDETAIAPNGNYVVKISVLKALGDRRNPAHWEHWTSPVITIARP